MEPSTTAPAPAPAPVNLLKFEPTLSGQDFRLRKLGIAASAVMVALSQSGTRFVNLLKELGEDQVKELLGDEGTECAEEIAATFMRAHLTLGSIYPVASPPPSPATEAAGSEDASSGGTNHLTPDTGVASDGPASGSGGSSDAPSPESAPAPSDSTPPPTSAPGAADAPAASTGSAAGGKGTAKKKGK